jgi:hypothetical protein
MRRFATRYLPLSREEATVIRLDDVMHPLGDRCSFVDGTRAGSHTMEAVSATHSSLEDAMALLQAGRVDEALDICRELVRSDASDSNAHALIGVCHAQKGDMDACVKCLETAALLNPSDPTIQYNLANALFQLGRIDKATYRLSRILEDDPEHPDAKLLLAHIQQQNVAVARAVPPGAAQAARPAVRPAPTVRQPAASEEYLPPSMGLRVLRGLGWGLLYCQTWTVFSLFAVAFLSLMATKVEHAIIAFVVMCLLTAGFHSAMGLLMGIVVALLNADEDGGGWVGASVGFLILIIGVKFGFLAMWGVVFYLLFGWYIGKAVGYRVSKPVGA